MRIVPVIDLRGGVVVHAVRGERAAYRPLRSALVSGAAPLDVAAALLARTGGDELYVADLDAIAGGPLQAQTLRALARRARVLADVGASTPARLDEALELGLAGIVVGTESLGPGGPGALLAGRPDLRVVLSIDLRGDALLSRDPALAGRPPQAVLEQLRHPQVGAALVLDLARVGTGLGPPLAAVEAAVRALPGTAVLAGGGVRSAEDLRRLERVGAAGALVATALHSGAVDPRGR